MQDEFSGYDPLVYTGKRAEQEIEDAMLAWFDKLGLVVEEKEEKEEGE